MGNLIRLVWAPGHHGAVSWAAARNVEFQSSMAAVEPDVFPVATVTTHSPDSSFAFQMYLWLIWLIELV
jgi:hypothetical protein